jgi:hypothetical protein
VASEKKLMKSYIVRMVETVTAEYAVHAKDEEDAERKAMGREEIHLIGYVDCKDWDVIGVEENV